MPLKKTSKFVALTESLPPSDFKRTQDNIGRVVLLGTTLFKALRASFKTVLLI